MTDYGRVFSMRCEDDRGNFVSDGVFMVVAPSPVLLDSEYLRMVLCLTGSGIWGGGRVEPGEIIPTYTDDPRIEWLD